MIGLQGVVGRGGGGRLGRPCRVRVKPVGFKVQPAVGCRGEGSVKFGKGSACCEVDFHSGVERSKGCAGRRASCGNLYWNKPSGSLR